MDVEQNPAGGDCCGGVTGACCPNGTVTRRDVLAGATAAATIAVLPVGVEAPQASAQAIAIAPPTPSKTAMPVSLNVNGQKLELTLEPRVSLLDALREYAGLTGTKKGCDHGQCGACTLLIDGQRRLSCLTLACMVQGREVTTVEGLAKGEELHPVQQAFIDQDAFQCGYCTPGQICSAVGLIKEGRAKTDEEIKEQMAGNICRCGAYPNIVAAVKQAMAAK